MTPSGLAFADLYRDGLRGIVTGVLAANPTLSAYQVATIRGHLGTDAFFQFETLVNSYREGLPLAAAETTARAAELSGVYAALAQAAAEASALVAANPGTLVYEKGAAGQLVTRRTFP